jgi:hypothetical protein
MGSNKFVNCIHCGKFQPSTQKLDLSMHTPDSAMMEFESACADLAFGEWKIAKIPHPSKGYVYICSDCLQSKQNYSQENDIYSHKEKDHGRTVSIEFEAMEDSPFLRLLTTYGFMPSYDASVDIEYKSKIYNSLCGIKQMFRSFDSYLTRSALRDGCGTHLNIGNRKWLDYDAMEFISSHAVSLFSPLMELIADDSQKAIRIWGRTFTGYAKDIREFSNSWYNLMRTGGNASEHCSCINFQHHNEDDNTRNWIEFRLAKYVNAGQYTRLMKLCFSIVDALETFNKYKSYSTAEISHKVAITGRKIAKLYDAL